MDRNRPRQAKAPRTVEPPRRGEGTGNPARVSPALLGPRSVAAVQRTAGNGAVQRLLRQITPAPASVRPSVQRHQGSSATAKDDVQVDFPHDMSIGGAVINTYEDAFDLMMIAAHPLLECQTFFKRVNSSLLPPEVKRALSQVTQLTRQYAGKSGIMSDHDLEHLDMWHEECEAAAYVARSLQAQIIQGDLIKKRDQVRRAQAEFERMEPALRDLQRQYFQSDEPRAIVVVGDAISAFISTQEEIIDLALKVETAVDHVHSWRTTRTLSLKMAEVTGPGASLVETLGKIKSTYEKIKKLTDTVSLLMPKRTANQDAMAAVVIMGMISDSGMSFGDAEILKTNLPLTGYPIGPMIGEAMKRLSYINRMRSEDHNRAALHLKRYDLVVWADEVGGRRMFNFIERAMRAAGPDQVPEVDEHVGRIFLAHADHFNGALGGRTKVPTEGTFWTTLKENAIKGWIFTHRKGIWGALYGSAPVPD